MNVSRPSIDIGFVAHDIDAMLGFYCDDLGLEKVDAVTLPGNRTMHRLRCGEGLVKIQELHDGAPDKGPDGITSQAGVRYFTIWLSDLPELAARLEAKGVRFARPLAEYRPGIFNAMVMDPDGNTIELSDDSRAAAS